MSLSEVLPGRQAMTHQGSWQSFLWGPLKATFPYFCGDHPTHSLMLRVYQIKMKEISGTFLVCVCVCVFRFYFFPSAFLGEIPLRHKVWSGGCHSPHPILNHDKVAEPSRIRKEETTGKWKQSVEQIPNEI